MSAVEEHCSGRRRSEEILIGRPQAREWTINTGFRINSEKQIIRRNK